MSDALFALERIYFAFQQSLTSMLAACPDQATRDQVMTQYVLARTNYFNCVNKAFHDDDPSVVALVTQAKTVALDLTNINKDLGDIAKVISYATQAVAVGAQIAGKVIAL